MKTKILRILIFSISNLFLNVQGKDECRIIIEVIKSFCDISKRKINF